MRVNFFFLFAWFVFNIVLCFGLFVSLKQERLRGFELSLIDGDGRLEKSKTSSEQKRRKRSFVRSSLR